MVEEKGCGDLEGLGHVGLQETGSGNTRVAEKGCRGEGYFQERTSSSPHQVCTVSSVFR